MNPDIREQIHKAVNSFDTIELESIPHFIREDFEGIRAMVFAEMNKVKNQDSYLPSWNLLEQISNNELQDVLSEKPGALAILKQKTFQACDLLPSVGPSNP